MKGNKKKNVYLLFIKRYKKDFFFEFLIRFANTDHRFVYIRRLSVKFLFFIFYFVIKI